MKIIELTGTASASGALTVSAPSMENGRIEKIVYDYTNGDAIADLVITEEGAVSQPVLTIANIGEADLTWNPRSLCNKVADGTAYTDVFDKIFVTGTMKAVVSGSTIAITTIDGDATTITLTATAHNLNVGDTVTIDGTTNYDGTYTVGARTSSSVVTIADTTHNEASESTGTMVQGGCTYRFLVYLSDLY